MSGAGSVKRRGLDAVTPAKRQPITRNKNGRRSLIVRRSIVIGAFVLPTTCCGYVYALDCPKFPEQVSKDWEVEVNAVVAKIGPVKGGELKTKTRNATEDLLVKLPDASKLYLEQMMFSAYCSGIRDDKTITETEKANRVMAYIKEVRQAIATPPPKPPSKPNPTSANASQLSDKFRRAEASLTTFPAEAEKIAEEIVGSAPQNAEGWYMLGRARYKLARYAPAIQAFEKAALLNPREARYPFAVGGVLAQINRHRDALQYYEKALKLNVTDGDTLYNMGYSYRELGQIKEALEYYNRAVDLGADAVPDAAFAIARIHAKEISRKGICDTNSPEAKAAFRALSVMLDRGGDEWARILLGQIPKRGAQQLDPLRQCDNYGQLVTRARTTLGLE